MGRGCWIINMNRATRHHFRREINPRVDQGEEKVPYYTMRFLWSIIAKTITDTRFFRHVGRPLSYNPENRIRRMRPNPSARSLSPVDFLDVWYVAHETHLFPPNYTFDAHIKRRLLVFPKIAPRNIIRAFAVTHLKRTHRLPYLRFDIAHRYKLKR